MSKIVVEAGLINAVIEQLDFHRDSLNTDEDKDYIKELIGDLESANDPTTQSQYEIIEVDVMKELNG